MTKIGAVCTCFNSFLAGCALNLGFAQPNFSIHAFLQAAYRAESCKEATNKTKQDKTKQTNQPTNQPTLGPQHKYPGSHYMKHHQKDKSIKLNDPSASPSCSSINRFGLLSILPTPHAPTKSKLNPSKLNASISSSRLIPYQAHSKLSTPNVHWNINNNIDLRGRGGNSIFYARSLGTQNKEKSGVWSAVMGFGCARLRASL